MLRVVTLLCLAAAVLGTPLKGVPRLDGRIVGGEDAAPGEFPYQLSLEIAGKQECGAIIISENWALTAAQCVGGSTLGMRLRAGVVDLDDPDNEGDLYTVVKKIVHPNFNLTTVDSDIALLQVDPPFKFGANIGAVVLSDTVPDDGTLVTTVGWGNTHSGGLPSTLLQKVEVNIVGSDTCKMSYGPTAITDNMICAGVVEGGMDACQGDSGGPLVVLGDSTVDPPSEASVVGIVSWGRGCALAAYPGVYTSVVAFRDWIRQESEV